MLLIKKRKDAGMLLTKPNPKAFLEYSNTMGDVYNNIMITIKKESKRL